MADAWKDIASTNSAGCSAFVSIMQRMDQHYSSLDAAQLSSWLAAGRGYSAFGWVTDKSLGIERMEVGLLGRNRGARRLPEVVMLGWAATQTGLIETIANKIIDKSFDWATTLGHDSVRCVVPKQMGSPWIAQLHQKLYEAITTPSGSVVLTRRVDLCENWLWYGKRQSNKSVRSLKNG